MIVTSVSHNQLITCLPTLIFHNVLQWHLWGVAETLTAGKTHTHTQKKSPTWLVKTNSLTHARTHTHTRLTALLPGLPGWAGTRKVKPIWILLKQETVSGSGISWAICKSAPRSRQITTPATHHSVFHRPDTLSAAQPTASKHWMTEGLWLWHHYLTAGERILKIRYEVIDIELINTTSLVSSFFGTEHTMTINNQWQLTSCKSSWADWRVQREPFTHNHTISCQHLLISFLSELCIRTLASFAAH